MPVRKTKDSTIVVPGVRVAMISIYVSGSDRESNTELSVARVLLCQTKEKGHSPSQPQGEALNPRPPAPTWP